MADAEQRLPEIEHLNEVSGAVFKIKNDPRLAGANCGNIWNETFSYDAFGNITKNAISGGYSWQPTYSSNNQYSSIPGVTGPYYDANGNVTNDGSNTYSWDADGNPVTVGSTGLTFDALDRMVEQNKNGTYYQIVYGPAGNKLGPMNGQTIDRIRVPMPGGGLAVYGSGPTFVMYWRQPDWRGSMPFASNYNQTVSQDSAFAPFGEEYVWNPGGPDDFTGQWAATKLEIYDFPLREYHPIQGRWLTPDPAGLAAANPDNPQSWNRYAYVTNNPLAIVDPLGLNGAQCLFSRHRYSGITSPCPAGTNYDDDGDDGAGGGLWAGLGNMGYSIADAIGGAPGTYITIDIYGNVSFGFSIDLWDETWSLIEGEENWIAQIDVNTWNDSGIWLGLNPNDVPTTGYVVFQDPLGNVSGLVPDVMNLSQQLAQLGAMVPSNLQHQYNVTMGAWGPVDGVLAWSNYLEGTNPGSSWLGYADSYLANVEAVNNAILGMVSGVYH